MEECHRIKAVTFLLMSETNNKFLPKFKIGASFHVQGEDWQCTGWICSYTGLSLREFTVQDMSGHATPLTFNARDE
jgi:hypothetical protein